MRPCQQPPDLGQLIAAAYEAGQLGRLFKQPGHAGRVTLVSAPAGSGKTVLLRSWALCGGSGFGTWEGTSIMSIDAAATNVDPAIRPFQVDIAEETILDFRRRIAAWRPPERSLSMISRRAGSWRRCRTRRTMGQRNTTDADARRS